MAAGISAHGSTFENKLPIFKLPAFRNPKSRFLDQSDLTARCFSSDTEPKNNPLAALQRMIFSPRNSHPFQCDAESNYLEQQYFNSQQQHLPPTSSTSSLPGGGIVYHPASGPGPGGPGGQQPGGPSGPNQIDVVLSEVCPLKCRSLILVRRRFRI